MDRIKQNLGSANGGGFSQRIPRKRTPATSGTGVPTRSSTQAKKSTRSGAKPDTTEINRDSKKQLNVSSGGAFYEKAKSRRTRQKAALEQSGNQDSAVALGKSKPRSAAKSTKSFEVEDLDKQLEQKSFLRRAKITHGLKKSIVPRLNTARRMKRQRKVQRQEEDTLEARRKKSPRSQLTAVERTLAVPTSTKKNVRTPKPAGTPKSKGSAKKQKSATRTARKDSGEQIKPDDTKSSGDMAEPSPVVIDLLSSDNDSDACENIAVQALTQLLQDKAIGRGATRKEMKAYAQCLFELGLHSREMILDALMVTGKTKKSNTNLASGIVNEWKWMKPFHKTVFCRWVLSQEEK